MPDNYQGDNTEGQAHARQYVKFGPKDHQEITLEVAEMVLTLWRERSPAVFGAYLGEILTGEKPQGSRGK